MRVFYDWNSNQTEMSKDDISYRTVQYNDRNKVSSITANNETVTFEYDANNSRYKREDNEQTVYYVGALELTYPKSSELTTNVIKRYVGNDAIQSYTVEVAADESISSHAELKWLFTDYQGSIIAITNEKYKIQQEFTYDAFGKQSVIIPTAVEAAMNYDLQTAVLGEIFGNLRGYTGHESLKLGDDNRVIHMNGRIYDAGTGRFMQTDPFVQAPGNLQNYNRYSYVLNNPMSYTDPSGYLFDKGFKTFKRAGRSFIRGTTRLFGTELVSMAGSLASSACGPAAGACAAAWNYEFTRAMGGTSSQAFKAGVIAGMTAQAFYEIGQHFKVAFKITKDFGFADLKLGQQLQWAGSHALVGGISSVASGGKFGHGFVSAGFTKMAMGNAGFNMNNRDWDAIAGRTIVAGIVGGTASQITGGKFANGARTAAMMHALNAEAPNIGSILSNETSKLGISVAFPEELLSFFGVDIEGADVELELGIVRDDTADIGGYGSISFTKTTGENAGRNFGLGLEYGRTQGNILDFSGESHGVIFAGQEITRGTNGNLGYSLSGKLGYAVGGVVTHTKTMSIWQILGDAKAIYGN
ncbi:RHS repeat domain-containing protein [Pseudoalteromonas umbrosa]|uniref:RHS repeat domain-containing protein n=1 Tax=Pseudoalteromonas umbrosa TaxID=3048489 RepID=UPI0024C21DAD|nr:RHS repeat-associated core domain-containing protein [Pseudoalteromonas sp. B95]MDK1287933.1 RHS repeat-associated core domain-containing protein [Pseudoalteromonas sp. B95]